MQNPHKRISTDHEAYKWLVNYTGESSTMYDKDFHDEMKGIAPLWFVNTRNSNQKKTAIADMCRSGVNKSEMSKELRNAFSSYISPSSRCYDTEFVGTIREINMKWLEAPGDARRREIREYAFNGMEFDKIPRLVKDSIKRYTTPGKKEYDGDFTAELLSSAPQWFSE